MSARGEAALRLAEKLRRELGRDILAWLEDDEVIEIMLNPDGALWVERLGRRPQRLGAMPATQAEALMMTLASLQGRVLNHRDPVIECQLPLDGSRKAVPRVVLGGVFFAVRQDRDDPFVSGGNARSDIRER